MYRVVRTLRLQEKNVFFRRKQVQIHHRRRRERMVGPIQEIDEHKLTHPQIDNLPRMVYRQSPTLDPLCSSQSRFDRFIRRHDFL